MTIRRQQALAAALILAATTGLAGCAGMTPRERNTAIGAAVGGVAGSILTNGNALGTVGGAAVGGVVGNQVRH